MPLLDHSDPPWPLFGKLSAALEGFIYYTHYSVKVILHDLSKVFPSASVNSNLVDIVMLLSGLFSFILGYFSDDLLGKYAVVLYTYVFVVIAFSISAISYRLTFLSVEFRSTIFLSSVYFWFPFFANEASRVAMISEQFVLPQSLRNLKMFYFCFILSRYAGAGMSGLIVEFERYFGGHETQLTIRFIFFFVVVFCYCAMLFFLSNHIRRKRVHVGFVDNVVTCIFSALYNRAFARKKMPANSRWIDYSDARHYKETKDSAVQLVQMSLIYLPFSLFFGLNEFLDVIWMEQNEWIISDDHGLMGSLSIITIYHAVDIILIPVFEYLIEFVAPRKCNIILTDLQLIGSAIFLLGLAYLSTTMFQSQIEFGTLSRDPMSASVWFFNALFIPVSISTQYSMTKTLSPGGYMELSNLKPLHSSTSDAQFTFPIKVSAPDILDGEDYSMLPALLGSTSFFVITENGIIELPSLKNPSMSHPQLVVVTSLMKSHSIVIKLKKIKGGGHHGTMISHDAEKFDMKVPEEPNVLRVELSNGIWKMDVYVNGEFEMSRNVNFFPRTLRTIFLYLNKSGNAQSCIDHMALTKNIHIGLAIPQILLRSLADGIGKISTYYFTYTQSPRKLRATAFGVLYFAQYSFPGIFGMISALWREGFTSFVLSLYTFIAFISLVLFIYFSLKYEEI